MSRLCRATGFALLLAAGAVTLAAGQSSPFEHLTHAQRLAAIRAADVWHPTQVASLDLRTGPQGKGAFEPMASVSCDYTDKKPSGSSAKFICTLDGDEIRVKYGEANVEVYAEVAASRLLWALGFGSDRWYPVSVTCHGCPSDPRHSTKDRHDSVTFDTAAIERKMPGKTMESKADEGWAWAELDELDPARAAEERPKRDALKLLAVFLQHTDSKPQQQRMVCPSDQVAEGASAACTHAFMFIHDSGLTFGRANFPNANVASGANFDRWAAVPIWKDPAKCVGKLSGSFTGTLQDPIISEGGRAFLSDLLAQLSDAQIQDMFSVARFDQHSGKSTDEWVALFKKKRDEIASVHCPAK